MRKIIISLLTIFTIFITTSGFAASLSFDHRKNYIIGGNEQSSFKTQFSFKYNISDPYELYKFKLFFAYTQKTFWNPYISNLHFHDINFIPEFFLDKQINKYHIDFFRLGLYEHKSNNQKDELSRGINRYYTQVQTSNYCKLFAVGLNLKVFNYYKISDKNSDYKKYTGYYESKLFIKPEMNSKEELYLKWSTGKDSYGFNCTKGYIETGLIVKCNLGKFKPHLFIQVYYGYDEAIIDYNEKQKTVRVGLLFY